VFVFEIDLDRLCGFIPAAVEYKELPRSAGDVLAAVKGLREPLLVDVQVFDIYVGKQLPPGKKSLGFGLTYMSRERTLTDKEVDEAHSRIVNHLTTEFDAVLR